MNYTSSFRNLRKKKYKHDIYLIYICTMSKLIE